ncbi:protoporphyrinogen oxidase [Virgibacillus halophilus]|uniref:protoporphyrinogen oxidase n=1 Tax=Tigheibacillus halophilus TaxID=361280 RepID=UPI00362FB218
MKMKKILIAGGGITGLATAYYLQKSMQENNLPYEIKLVEASNRLGGKVQTVRHEDFVIERGPDSFLERKQPIMRLIESLGMNDQLVRNATGQSYILVDGKLRKMPKGAHMGVPTQIRPFLFSGMFSTKGKLRAAMDYVLPKGKTGDQSLGGFFRRRFGDELVENCVEPLLSGIYAGDIDNMSLLATFPNFYTLEQEHRSLIKGLKESSTGSKKQLKTKSSKKKGMFLTLRNGLESMIEELESQLGQVDISLRTSVDHVERKEQGYHVLLSDGTVYKADAIVMTTPHYTLPKIFSQYDYFRMLEEVPSTSVATIAMAFDAAAIKKDMDGTGFVVSRNSDYRITACTWTHKKWPNAAPAGKALVRCYVGRPDDQSAVELSDKEIIDVVLKDLNKTMKIKKKPEFYVISRWKNAMPQYTVGHIDRVNQIRNESAIQLPGIFFAGSSFEGIGLPDCIGQGEQAVESVLNYFRD